MCGADSDLSIAATDPPAAPLDGSERRSEAIARQWLASAALIDPGECSAVCQQRFKESLHENGQLDGIKDGKGNPLDWAGRIFTAM